MELSVRGILAANEVVRVLGKSDVLLFARGPISTRRSSAIAGITCGLPVVAARGRETAAPITEAGVVLTEPGEPFGPALARILSDAIHRESLADRSRKEQQNYFSWQAIAQQYISALQSRAATTRKPVGFNKMPLQSCVTRSLDVGGCAKLPWVRRGLRFTVSLRTGVVFPGGRKTAGFLGDRTPVRMKCMAAARPLLSWLQKAVISETALRPQKILHR